MSRTISSCLPRSSGGRQVWTYPALLREVQCSAGPLRSVFGGVPLKISDRFGWFIRLSEVDGGEFSTVVVFADGSFVSRAPGGQAYEVKAGFASTTE